MPFPDPRVALATLHGKAAALAPGLRTLGLGLVDAAVDTDALGTFAGDIERPAPAREVVVRKARLGMAATGLPLGLASEASFGPDPVIGVVPLHVEWLAFVDDVHGQVLVLEAATHETNWQSKAVRGIAEAEAMLGACGFPDHAVLVRPNRWVPGAPILKGLRERAAVASAIAAAAVASADGMARIDTDMRAHMNPTRMRQIASLGERLATRLATPCPACHSPGFGVIGANPGLPCSDCGTPTERILNERHGCGVCGHAEVRPRSDGLAWADPGTCPVCNP